MRLTFFLILLSLSSYSQNLLPIKDSRGYGYISLTGEKVLNTGELRGDFFYEGLAKFSFAGKSGYIDTTGNIVIQNIFDFANDFVNGRAIVSKDSMYGLIDKKGNFLIQPKFDRIYFQSSNRIAAKNSEGWDFYSLDGDRITNESFTEVWSYSEGFAAVKTHGRHPWKFIDTNGNYVNIPPSNNVYSGFNNGLAIIIDSNNKIRYINHEGIDPFNTAYFEASRFSEGLAFVKDSRHGKEYLIDTTGNRVSENEFETSWWFSEGCCGVETDSSYAIIDHKGQIVFESETIELRFFANGFGFFCDRSGDHIQWGIMNKNFEIISDKRFNAAFSKQSNKFIEYYFGEPGEHYLNGKRGYMDMKGEIIWEESKD